MLTNPLHTGFDPFHEPFSPAGMIILVIVKSLIELLAREFMKAEGHR
jgi:hypothetical protein